MPSHPRHQSALADSTRRDATALWLTCAIVLVVAALRIGVLVVGGPDALTTLVRGLPVLYWLEYAFYLYLVVLIWVSYRYWRRAIGQKRDLSAILRSISPDVVLVVRPDRTIAMCNASVEDMFGYTPDELLHMRTNRLYSDRRGLPGNADTRAQLDRVGFHVGPAEGRRRDGSRFPLEIVTSLLENQSGAVLLLRDTTERKRAEDALRQAKEEAETNYAKLKETEAARDHLTHMIVHDLKAPLTSIIGFLGLLQRTLGARLDEKSARYVRESRRLAERLTEMIATLLDVGRFDDGRLEVARTTCDLAELARAALELIGPDASNRVLTIEPAGTPVSAVGDPVILKRVLMNLLSNAVKYTPPGKTIRVCLERGADEARFAVIDEGTGIAPEYHDRIFERFRQMDAREFSTGLGLTFCKLAVEAHGGTIRVESAPGRGSAFHVSLPDAPAPSDQPA
jgi:PAS domain S-box-containing protein